MIKRKPPETSCRVNSYLQKLALTILWVLSVVPVIAQVDLKNTLPALNTRFAKASNQTDKIGIALALSNFYLNNKAPVPATIDSANRYATLAENLSKEVGYQKGTDDALVLKASILLVQNKTKNALELARIATGSLYCRLHITIGKYFLQKPEEKKRDLHIADSCLTAAQLYSERHHMPVLSLLNLTYRYPLAMEQGQKQPVCEEVFNQLIRKSRSLRKRRVEAGAWYTKAAYAEKDSMAEKFFKRSMTLAHVGRDTGMEISCLKQIADINLRAGQLDIAEKQLKNVIQLCNAAGFKNTQFAYDLLTAVYMAKGNLEAAMRSGLNAVRIADSTGTESGLNFMQYKLAIICRDMGLFKESLKWSQRSLDNTVKIYNYFPFLVYRDIAAEMIREGKAELVLRQLATAIKRYKTEEIRMVFVPMIKGDCYVALGKPALAEKFYLQAVDLFEQKKIYGHYYFMSCNNIAAFYISRKRFDSAQPYLQKIFNQQNTLFSSTELATAHQLQFKIDSAKSDYLSAIKHFEKSKNISDSIFNKVKIRQSEQLQIQFEIAQRERENLMLRNRNSLQISELQKEHLNRKLITLALFGSILILGLMTYLYRAKQKSNAILKLRQNEINEHNMQLNQLLQEKEWLMKEIHHRVKNNLQIVSSLLNTQSSYLTNEDALTAIRDSQNRMQAISIVHQKLYQSENLSTINLENYIEELAQNIQNSFHAVGRVRFSFQLEDIYLTTADTVPLGLILNEAITNSVKYAFAPGETGVISISMSETREGQYRLVIKDNGKGLPLHFDASSCSSLGINLMVGLTEQLNGKFSIISDNGTVVTVIFHPSSSELR
jgi:two-component sensor histidine kinase